MAAPRLRVFEIGLATRPAAPVDSTDGPPATRVSLEAFGFVNIQVEGRGITTGRSALVIPNVPRQPGQAGGREDLARSWTEARDAYLAALRWSTGFDHHHAARRSLERPSVVTEGNLIAVDMGCTLIDMAILDALLAAYRLSTAVGLSCNIPGIDARLAPDLPQASVNAYLASRRPSDVVLVQPAVAPNADANVANAAPATIGTVSTGKQDGPSAASKNSSTGPYDRIAHAARQASTLPQATPPSGATVSSIVIAKPGLAFQQDLALQSTLGLRELQIAMDVPTRLHQTEATSLMSAYPSLYAFDGDTSALRVRTGQLDISTLNGPGLASHAAPFPEDLDWLAG